MTKRNLSNVRRALSRALAGTSATLFVLTAVGAALAPTAVADTTPNWGPDGIAQTTSEVTVRYDNVGNSAENTVHRTPTTVLPHTGGKTYADLDPVHAARLATISANLTVTVSQTKNLTNQNVRVVLSGFTGGTGSADGTIYDIMQCWGTPGADGKPDPNAGPDPETCQTRGRTSSGELINDFVSTSEDLRLLAGGDWQNVNSSVPFRAIDGTVPGKKTEDGTFLAYRAEGNPYFNGQTSNFVRAHMPSAGVAERPFELQTTAESQGLGCGIKADTPSTSRCWLVVVPSETDSSSLRPSTWAQRVQVALDFANIGEGCPSGQKRTILTGSELLAPAMASWAPALCAEENIAVGYALVGDVQVRREINSGTRTAGVLSQPGKPDGFHVPVGLSAVVVGYRGDRTDNVNQWGQIKLNPRLVAKLLTQSYGGSTDYVSGSQIADKAPWFPNKPVDLATDPEYTQLNPGVQSANQIFDLIASLTQSDAVETVWRWILADEKAASFLHGCEDGFGMVINPYFSTRTYDECKGDGARLDATAAEKLKATKNPDGFIYVAPTYPPASASFPQPSWYERDAVTLQNGNILEGRLTLTDLHPRLNALTDVGRSLGRSIYPRNSVWCSIDVDDTCQPAPGKWKSDSAPQQFGHRSVMGITDSVTAARFGLQTALLCATEDTKGERCLGANDATLTKAAEGFTSDGVVLNNPLFTGGKADYAAGAYPMTLPIYASIIKKDLKETNAKTYADIFERFTTAGQKPGYAPGELPYGYAPLTKNLLALSETAIAGLRAYTEPPKAAPTTPPPVKAPPAAAPPAAAPPAAAPAKPAAPKPAPTKAANQAAQNAPQPAPTAAAVANPVAVAKVGTTPATEQGFPQFGLVGGLAGAVLTGLAAPLVGGPKRRNET